MAPLLFMKDKSSPPGSHWLMPNHSRFKGEKKVYAHDFISNLWLSRQRAETAFSCSDLMDSDTTREIPHLCPLQAPLSKTPPSPTSLPCCERFRGSGSSVDLFNFGLSASSEHNAFQFRDRNISNNRRLCEAPKPPRRLEYLFGCGRLFHPKVSQK